MIEPQELRLGNHYYCSMYEQPYIGRVTHIDTGRYHEDAPNPDVSEINVVLYDLDCPEDSDPFEGVNFVYLDPIPITKELLSKIGFTYHEYINGKLWEYEFKDGFHDHFYLEEAESTSYWDLGMWSIKEIEIHTRVIWLHELEDYVRLVYHRNLINP